jgi:Flp pilus assembly pilin Flp
MDVSNYLLRLYVRLRTVARPEDGQGLVEYALIIAFIAVVCVGGLTILGGDINELLKEVGAKL